MMIPLQIPTNVMLSAMVQSGAKQISQPSAVRVMTSFWANDSDGFQVLALLAVLVSEVILFTSGGQTNAGPKVSWHVQP